MELKKFFHEISDEEVQELFNTHWKWKDVMETYRQPTWCQYPDALAGKLGCWSLTDLLDKILISVARQSRHRSSAKMIM